MEKEKIKLKPEQERAIYDECGNIMLSASAGSGKTFVMIERIIRLIKEGKATVKDILAVTFTEASAEDMKSKLQDAIIDAYKEADEKTAEKFSEQLADIATANISTLHSFCLRLIKKYCSVAEVDSACRIADEGVAKTIKNNAVDKLFRDLYKKIASTDKGDSEYPEWFINLCDLHFKRRRDKDFKETVIGLYEFAETEANPSEFLDRASDIYTAENVDIIIRSITDYYVKTIDSYKGLLEDEKERVKDNAKLLTACEKSIGYADYVTKDVKEGFVCEKDYRMSLPTSCEEEYALSLKSIREYKDRIKKSYDKCKDIVCSLNEDREYIEEYRKHVSSLVELTKRYGEYYRKEKETEGVLDFNDLEHLAIKILSNEEARKEIQSEFKYIFVDECQDINGAQDFIINNLANGNLFRVGDVKQSIYGFRGCRPELFKTQFEKLKDGEGAKRLNCNFRSATAVIEAVNRIFAYAMKPDTYGETYTGSELREGGIYGKDYAGRFKFYNIVNEEKTEQEKESDKETPRIYNICEEIKKEKENEVSYVAGLISRIIYDEKNSDYYSLKEKGLKGVQFGDIAILTRSGDTPWVQKIVSGLSNNGIPVVSSVEQKVCDYAEVKLFIEVLKLIECFENDIPLATVLKSPIGKLSDDELAKIVNKASDGLGKTDGFYQAYCYYRDNVDDDISEKIRKFEEYYKEIRFLSEFESAGDILDRVIRDNDLEAFMLASVQGGTKIKRVRAFISASRKESGDYGVREFLDYIEKSKDQITLNSSDAVENAVKVMTIHASKGLEYPVVIFCGAERDLLLKKRYDREVYKDREYGIIVKRYEKATKKVYETGLSKYVKAQNDKKLIADEIRLFYVALTRAKYSLYIVSEDGKRSNGVEPKTFIDLIPPEMKAEDVTSKEILSYSWDKNRENVICVDAKQSEVDKMKETFNFKYPHEFETKLSLKTSVTGALTLGNTEVSDEEKTKSEEIEEEIKEDGGTIADAERGVIAHKILELTDFGRPFDEQKDEIIEKGNLKDVIDKVDLEKLKNCIDIIKSEIGNGKLYREKSFLCSIPAYEIYGAKKEEEYDKKYGEPVLVQGIIDLLVIEDGKAKIIDYKYSHKNEERLKETYRKQLDLYAFAVENSLENVKVEKKIIISLIRGKSVTL